MHDSTAAYTDCTVSVLVNLARALQKFSLLCSSPSCRQAPIDRAELGYGYMDVAGASSIHFGVFRVHVLRVQLNGRRRLNCFQVTNRSWKTPNGSHNTHKIEPDKNNSTQRLVFYEGLRAVLVASQAAMFWWNERQRTGAAQLSEWSTRKSVCDGVVVARGDSHSVHKNCAQ